MAKLNYATEYSQALAQAYPYTLYFGALWTATKEDVKFLNSNTIQLPSLKVKGRKNGNRDTIGTFGRNFDNEWEPKTLKNHRTWDTLVHPRDIDETNKVASIQNITKTMNEEQKFPEMDAEAINAVYSLKNEIEVIEAKAKGYITAQNVLTEFDVLMDKMDEERVPASGRILYVDTYTKTLIDTAKDVVRTSGNKVLGRTVSRIDEVEIVSVPTTLMKTSFTFKEDDGFEVSADAKDVKMMLVHLSAIIPAISYEFAQLESPSALSQGKYVYFEESFEDMFIYNKKHDAIQFLVEETA
ncbi:MAG: capsid protein [Bacilli bacterium]|nr:capsid protein [Bacilli bacterium]